MSTVNTDEFLYKSNFQLPEVTDRKVLTKHFMLDMAGAMERELL